MVMVIGQSIGTGDRHKAREIRMVLGLRCGSRGVWKNGGDCRMVIAIGAVTCWSLGLHHMQM